MDRNSDYFMQDQVHDLVSVLMSAESHRSLRSGFLRVAQIGILAMIGAMYSVILVWQI